MRSIAFTTFAAILALSTFAGCEVLSSLEAQWGYNKRLDHHVGIADKQTMEGVMGKPARIRTIADRERWEYYTEIVDGSSIPAGSPDQLTSPKVDVVYLYFDENGLFVDWNLMASRDSSPPY